MEAGSIPGSDNRVFLNERGIIEIHVVGTQTPLTVHDMGDAVLAISQRLRMENTPVLILDNLLRMSIRQPSSVPRTVALEAKRIDFDRAVMLGPDNALLKHSSNFIIKGIGKTDIMRYCTDQQEAEEWLLAFRPLGAR